MKNRVVILAFLPVLLSACTNVKGSGDFVYPKLKKKEIGSVESSLVERTASLAIQDVEGYLATSEENAVVSPASYLLATAGLSAVSDSFPNQSFGLLENSGADLKALLGNWNFEYHKKEEYEERYCSFQSAVVHQQVGETYRFDQKKREKAVEDYVSTIVSKQNEYHADAEKLFHEEMGFKIPVPDPELTEDGVITYGAFKMKDYVPNGLGTADRLFLGKNVSSHTFGSIYHPSVLAYFKGENYQVFLKGIANTSLLIILPDEGIDLGSIIPSAAYSAFMAGKRSVDAMGYIPYFHTHTEMADLTEKVTAKMTGHEVFYSKLLADDVYNDLTLSAVLQSSDFEFNKYGVAGESITMEVAAGESMPEEHEVIHLEVNRPFYAISIKDWFPLFVNKVVSL